MKIKILYYKIKSMHIKQLKRKNINKKEIQKIYIKKIKKELCHLEKQDKIIILIVAIYKQIIILYKITIIKVKENIIKKMIISFHNAQHWILFILIMNKVIIIIMKLIKIKN